MFDYSLPVKELKYVVERIYEIDIPRASSFADNRVIPMHTGTITFVLKGNSRVKYKDGIKPVPNAILSGQYYPTFAFDSDGPSLIYGIALKPMATHKIFDIYLPDIKNNFIHLSEVIGDEADTMRKKLLQANSTKKRYTILNDFMLQRRPSPDKFTHLELIIDYIYKKKGILKVMDICEHESISRRYLEKKFKKFIGFTPGQFIRQVRFNYACTEIAAGATSVKEILEEFGYFDRSHFMKKFKKFYGDDLSVLTGDDNNIFKAVFSRIMQHDSETRYHP